MNRWDWSTSKTKLVLMIRIDFGGLSPRHSEDGNCSLWALIRLLSIVILYLDKLEQEPTMFTTTQAAIGNPLKPGCRIRGCWRSTIAGVRLRTIKTGALIARALSVHKKECYSKTLKRKRAWATTTFNHKRLNQNVTYNQVFSIFSFQQL